MEPEKCFSQLAGFDPNNPDGKPAASSDTKVVPKKKKAVKSDDLDDLLSAGLAGGKKGKGKRK